MSTQNSFVMNDSIQDIFSSSEIIENNFSSEINYEHLRVIFSEVLSTVSFIDIEDNIFKDEIPKLKFACTEVVSKLKEAVQKNVPREVILEELKELLQMYINLLKLVHEALKYICNKIQFKQVQSLPLPVCEIILQTFMHCKQSDTIYGNYFVSLSELLTVLFKKANEVQTSFLNLVNNILIFDLREDHELYVIVEVGRILSSIGEVVTGLDIKTAAEVWKAFLIFSQTYKNHLKYNLNIDPTINYLSSEVIEAIQIVISTTDMKSAEKQLKIASFNLKIVIKLCGLYEENLGIAYEKLFDLLIAMNRYTVPYLQLENRNKKFIDLMQNYIIVATEPFLGYLISDRQFIAHYFKRIKFHFDNDDTRLSAVFLTLSIMKKILSCKSDVQNQWLSSDTSCNVLCLIFYITDQLHVELSLDLSVSMPITSGEMPKMGSLYDFLLVHVNALVVILSEKKFKLFQKILIQSLLQGNSWKALLSLDVWCIIARYGTPDFCYNQINFLLNLLHCLKNQNRPETIYLFSIISRLFSFLTNEHKIKIATEYPLTDYPKLWSLTELKSGTFHNFNANNIVNIASEKIDILLNNKPIFEDFDYMRDILELISTCTVSEINTTNAKGFASQICKLWYLNFNTQLYQSYPWISKFVKSLFKATSCLIEYFTNEELLKILKIVSELSLLNTRSKLATCIILDSLATKMIDVSPEQKDILDTISSLFKTLLQDTCPLVRQAALETFDYFAHHTKHESILPVIVEGNTKLQEDISNFLQKITQISKSSNHQYLQTQKLVVLKHVCGETISCLEPQEKKKKLTNDVNVNVILQRMKHDCDSLVEYCENERLLEMECTEISGIILKLQRLLQM